MTTWRISRRIAAAGFIFCLAPIAYADSSNFELQLRGGVLLGDGVPANDILGVGVIARFYRQNGWFFGATLDNYQYDFEVPSDRVVGIPQDPAVDDIDADASNTVLGGFFGRQYGSQDDGFDWFWTLGVGVGFPDVKDVSGPTAGGGIYDLTFDAKTEIHLMGVLGTSYHFNERWSATAAARAEHHFMDITVTDRVSGMTGQVDSQSPLGGYLSVNYRFR